jgi:hypothetical protein
MQSVLIVAAVMLIAFLVGKAIERRERKLRIRARVLQALR